MTIGAVLLATLACRKFGSKGRTAPKVVPPTPIVVKTAPKWPLPPSAKVERVRQPQMGTVGTFVATPNPSPEPITGAIVPTAHGPAPATFGFRAAEAAAPIGAGDHFLVLARPGLWLVESESMATVARLVPNASGDVASSPDGKRFAYGACTRKKCAVHVREFPSLKTVVEVPVKSVSRLRFSTDGKLLAVSSVRHETATVVDVSTGKLHELSCGNDVNDATFIDTAKKWVAYSTDSDATVIRNWETKVPIFDSTGVMHSALGRGFDQNAVAYDAKRDVLFSGGNDDSVWRFEAVSTGAPTLIRYVAFGNDVEDIALLPNGDALVGLDSGTVSLLKPSGKIRTALGTPVPLISAGARLALDRRGYLLAVLNSAVWRWRPGDGLATRSTFFEPVVRFDADYTQSDVVLTANGRGAGFTLVVLRASLNPSDPLDVSTERLGTLKFSTHSPRTIAFNDGTRLFVGDGGNGKLVIYRLPLGKKLGAAKATAVPYQFMQRFVNADGNRIGHQAGSAVAELNATGERILGTLKGRERLQWDTKEKDWRACTFRKCRELK